MLVKYGTRLIALAGLLFFWINGQTQDALVVASLAIWREVADWRDGK